MKKTQLAIVLLLFGMTSAIFAQERGHPFSLNYKGSYYLRTLLTGDELSLESNNPSNKDVHGAAFMSPQKGAIGTMWQFVMDQQNPGWYRLKSEAKGNDECLECNRKNNTLKGGASFMDQCQNVSGQLWRLELVSSKNGDHVYRLRSKLHGKTFSLEGGAKYGRTFMDNTQNVSGQMWRLIPVK